MTEYRKRGYLLENFRLFHLRSETGEQVDFHYHEFCKVLLLLSGQGSYSVEGNRYRLSPGDVVLLGSRSVHRPELEAGVPYERIIIYIAPEFLQQQSGADCDLLAIFSGQKGHVLRPSEGRRKKLFSIAAALERELSRDGFGRDVISRAHLLQLVVEIGRGLAESADLPSPILPENPRILEIMDYLEGNLGEDVDMDALAERFYISKFHMMRLFRRETGSTIHTWLTQRRLMHARDLMAGGMSATQACYTCGFRNYSSFTRAYGRHFGSTPTGRVDKRMVRGEDAE